MNSYETMPVQEQHQSIFLPVGYALSFSLLALYPLTSSGRIGSGNGEAMYHVARSLVTRGSFDIAPLEAAQDITPQGAGEPIAYGAVGPDGRYYAKYGLGTLLAMIPFLVLGQLVAPMVSSPVAAYLPRMAETVRDQRPNSERSLADAIDALAINVPDFWFVYLCLLDDGSLANIVFGLLGLHVAGLLIGSG